MPVDAKSARPIESRDDDLLSRGPVVDLLARWCRQSSSTEGTTFALTGPWGSGKTSVLNLLENELAREDYAVLRFEPWLFNSADDLVTRYFAELAELVSRTPSDRFKQLAGPLSRYAAALSPLASTLAGPIGAALELPTRLIDSAPPSVIEVRNQLRKTLMESSVRIVVTVDDIDRLSPTETAEVLRLVKVVADLPRVIHVLSFDHARTCEALERAGHSDGQHYLEKIVQTSVPLPEVPTSVLRKRVLEQLGDAIGDRELVSWNGEDWARMFERGIAPHIANLRDGRRWATTAPYLLDLCGDEVCSMDVLALSALQAFEPVVHAQLNRIAGELTRTRDSWDYINDSKNDADARIAAAIDPVLADADDPASTEALLRVIFPAFDQLRGGFSAPNRNLDLVTKRVASRQVLSRYLHAQIDEAEAASATVAAALNALDDAAAFREVIESTDGARLDDLYDRMRLHIEHVDAADLIQVGTAILESIERIPANESRLVIGRERRPMWLLGALVSRIVPEPERANVILSLIDAAPTLPLKVALFVAFRCPETREPRGDDDILQGESLEAATAKIVESTTQASAEEIARCEPLLWLIGWVATHQGTASAAKMMEAPSIIEGLFSQHGTELMPLSSGRERIDLTRLAEAVSESGLEEIRRRLPGTSVPPQTQTAFLEALEELSSPSGEPDLGAAEASATDGDDEPT